ncbi:hypothetical protein GCM10010869_29140 [Mesorhizobium tianshanense]|uniref:Uncharacterized protein n=1 Tax=Mesorhizobium tianshanense TaxID=39844 RepID=A0A562NG72_9HYPH|nr:hypothetical protein [Mesorhizobium tianshanense]TWI31127.1 hypothetical protein IQ26_04630 [Mesorhizobium tianshanense]GLS37321.1 hypothetical protein GCM10010869_29140 [Mesorhizobium tianshanense]
MANAAEFPGSPTSLAELERFLGVAAYLVVRHGETYTPTFERLEHELEEARRRFGNRDRARRVLAELIQNGGHVGAKAIAQLRYAPQTSIDSGIVANPPSHTT